MKLVDWRRSRIWRAAGVAAAVLLLASAPVWGRAALSRMAFFRVRRVEILGARYVSASDILARLHVDTMASVWDRTAPLAARLATHPEIRTVEIERKLPGTLVVALTERVPVALVPTASGFRPYDERGVALPIDPARSVVDAPILAQPDPAIFLLLSQLRRIDQALYARVSEVRPVWDGGRVGGGVAAATAGELVLQLASVQVRVMKNVSAQRLSDIEPVERDLARRQLYPTELDLRYRDQVIARVK